jgi:hypothetical protein
MVHLAIQVVAVCLDALLVIHGLKLMAHVNVLANRVILFAVLEVEGKHDQNRAEKSQNFSETTNRKIQYHSLILRFHKISSFLLH